MTFDLKKEYKELYLPGTVPSIINVPGMDFIAVRGSGDPNEKDGEYAAAIGKLYTAAYAVKMSGKKDMQIEGYYDFVVPPLEGFWWQEGTDGMDYSRKRDLKWISVIRLPDFITEEILLRIVERTAVKKKTDLSGIEFMTLEEGLCVQCMHLGPYDTEPATVLAMHELAEREGLEPDLTDTRLHHEIYLSDARRTAPEKLRTVIRHPVRKRGSL